ncbi:MAG: peptidyl-prolyl cis-trans isomerase [Capsulimonadaceae bacterium]|nr:peptidyl-prolyl cis-trans isomerase [Capsulimonadaceae bacterium]
MIPSSWTAARRCLAFSAPASALIFVIVLAGCHSEDKVTPTGAPVTSATIATVNGDPIDAASMFDAMQHYTPVKSQADLNNMSLTQPVGRTVLSQLIQNVILIQTAKQKNVPVTDAAVGERYNYIKQLEEKSNTTEPFEQYLADQGYTVDSFEKEQIKPLVARLNLAAIGQTVADAGVRGYYDHHPEKYTFPERVHIQRVVLPDKATADAAREDAQKVGSFKNFLERSIDEAVTGGADGSDVPKWEPLSGPGVPFPPQLLTALQKAKPGDVIAPVQLQPGHWWVIRVADRQPAGKLAFDQIASQVKLDALSDQGMRSVSVIELQQSLKTSLQTANIEIVPKQYQSLIAQFKAKEEPVVPAGAPGQAPPVAPQTAPPPPGH